MSKVLIAGSGKIGSMIAALLSEQGDYECMLIDNNFSNNDISRLRDAKPDLPCIEIDVTDNVALSTFMKKENFNAVVSSLPYFLNRHIIPLAKEYRCHYFDLTEDTDTADYVKVIAKDAQCALVPQCGLAPGFISITANHLMSQFDHCEYVHCRVGALPQFTHHALQYALTWSIDGLINIYGNPCPAIANGKPVMLEPLADCETLQLDGLSYEAFNTSGGLGGLPTRVIGRVDELNYKTIRYPGHANIMRLLMQDLGLNKKRDILKQILLDSLPHTYDDVVLIYVAAKGRQGDNVIEKSTYQKIYPQKIQGLKWSAIQVTTASEICAVMDIILHSEEVFQGWVLQESFTLADIMKNRFGRYYQTQPEEFA